jgi:glycosyltransferase involved in cell wall biosynthesis
MVKQGHQVYVYSRRKYMEGIVEEGKKQSQKNAAKSETNAPKNNEQSSPDQLPTEHKGVKLIYVPTVSYKFLDTIVHTFFASIHALFSDYAVIHYQAPGPSTLCWIIKWFKPKAALIATFNSQDRFHQKWGFFARQYLKWGERIISTIPHKTVAVTKIIQNIAKKEYGSDLAYIPNGAAIKKEKKTNHLNQYKIKPNEYFLTINRLVKHKGIHYLINAFNKLTDNDKLPKNFKLVIIGGSTLIHTTEYEEKLKTLAKDRTNIIFTGTLQGECFRQIFSHAFSFVQPSEAEGLSNAVLEAMGLGKAIIVSDIKENLEAINSNQNALIFKNKDDDDLNEKMNYLLKDPNKKKTLEKNALKYAKKNYDWKKITEKYLKVYEDVLKKMKK